MATRTNSSRLIILSTNKDLTNVNQNDVTLPKLSEEHEKDDSNNNGHHIVRNESYTSYGSDDDSEHNYEGANCSSPKDSPIKKWLSHNRNFDIKINLVVGKDEKVKGK